LFFSWRNFAKFRPEKYDFDLYKGFLMKKWHKFVFKKLEFVTEYVFFG